MTSPLGDPSKRLIYSKPSMIYGAVKDGGPVLIFNFDSVNNAYVGYKNNITTENSTTIPPLTYAIMDSSRTMYGYCPTASIVINITPGGTYQSASPLQIAEVLQPNLQTVGTAGPQTPAQSGEAIIAFQAPSRVWGVTLSGVVAAGAAYVTGFNDAWFSLLLNQNSVANELAQLVLAIQIAGQVEEDSIAMPFPAGIPMNTGDQVQININGGASITQANLRATATVIYSTP